MIQYPFTAIVGMERAKKSLVYHAIDSRIGGTLFMGHRGCAKSTLVRAFAELLHAVSNGNAPFVEVPLGTSEDRLLGSVNAQALVEQGKWQGHTGLIEQANGGVLYIDEVNLLPDQLADFILDSAASGRYRMERDGITRVVESRYILVGTMNPEEGDLRPQLSDRFAHGIQVEDEFTPQQRMQIVQRRMEFDDDPEAFVSAHRAELAELVARIDLARKLLKRVRISPEHRLTVAQKGEALKLEGMRAELAVVRTARCAAAWEQREQVTEADIEEAWLFCLGHRQPNQEPPTHSKPPVPPRGSHAGSHTPLPPSTPPAPYDSHQNALTLSTLTKLSVDELSSWAQSAAFKLPHGSKRTSMFTNAASEAPVNWLATLVHSAKLGWTRGSGSLYLVRSATTKDKTLWCFLDASRSTGMSKFLANARDVIISLTRTPVFRRYQVLLLHGGRAQWLARNATARACRQKLASVRDATGKSLITQSLKKLRRAILKRERTTRERVLLCSDGLTSPLPGQSAIDAQASLRRQVEALIHTGVAVGWLHPTPKRGLSAPLNSLCRALPIKRFATKS